MQLLGRKGDTGYDPGPAQNTEAESTSDKRSDDDFVNDNDGTDDLPF